MTYGYNSKLTASAIHTTADFTKSFLEELKKARPSEEVGPPSRQVLVVSNREPIGEKQADHIHWSQLRGYYNRSGTLGQDPYLPHCLARH